VVPGSRIAEAATPPAEAARTFELELEPELELVLNFAD
jgi:hypothetical protein